MSRTKATVHSRSAYRQALRALTLTALLAVVGGCAVTSVRTVDAELARQGTGLRQEAGQTIEGYRLQDATEHEFKGRVRLAGTDSLAFWSDQPADGEDEFAVGGQQRVAGPVLLLTTVAALRVVEIEYTRAVLGAAAGVALVAWMINDWNDSWDWNTAKNGGN
ncbi:MAG: hypothetical protein IH621_05205 [Krumholzibacteria bacterium]|nr:hypothetical protein [Candidatus Krumholzibacteria bacterium]